jgi:SHS2 domain-containing protein
LGASAQLVEEVLERVAPYRAKSSPVPSADLPLGMWFAARVLVARAVEASHVFEEHTGEVRLRLCAPSLAALFEEAARALAELMLDHPAEHRSGPAQRVAVHASDREALLVAWIDELIFLSETRKLVWAEPHVERMTDTDLEAVVHGIEPVALRTAVKGATMHDLVVRERQSQDFEATLVLDV